MVFSLVLKIWLKYVRYLKLIFFIILKRGIIYVLREVVRKVRKQPVEYFFELKEYFFNKQGIEVGGPSKVFLPSGALPIYKIAKEVDNVNYRKITVWGDSSLPLYRKTLICEATNLSQIKDESYDFLITSHTIEHLANPLKALHEWKRVLKKEGVMLIVFPNKELTFDHKRPITDVNHIISDFENKVDETDLSHLIEVLSFHDISLDPDAGTFKDFVIRSYKNYKYRCLHHHVFSQFSIAKILGEFLKMEIVLVRELPLNSIVVVAKKF
jgi:SAM-dependent methyltransferase